MRFAHLFLLLTGVGIACSVSSAAHAERLPEPLAQVLGQHGISPHDASLEIRAMRSNRILVSHNPDTARNPASVIKLLTTLAALETLGPAFRWHTRYHIEGKLAGDTLVGNLVLEGGGDPLITVERIWRQVTAIRDRGIRVITGDLVIDDSLYDIAAHDRAAFDGKPWRSYNVGPDPALVNFSSTRFVMDPIPGRTAVLADPPLWGLHVHNELKTVGGKCRGARDGWTHETERRNGEIHVTFRGNYRKDCGEHSFFRVLASSHEYTYRLFRHLWQQSGGVFSGTHRTGSPSSSALLLISFPSKPLSDVIRGINKFSNNVMARMLLLALDTQESSMPATLSGARKRVAGWLSDNGIAMPGLVLDNGSGLSRRTRVTVAGLANLLDHGWQSDYRPEFLSSLALSGLDGTMRKRLSDGPVRGRARIKTGLIRGVRSMAGYITSRRGTRYSVAMVIESGRIGHDNGNRIQDAVLQWLYSLDS